MDISFCTVQTDQEGRELIPHGTALFPVSCYDEDLVQIPVAWHWHDDLEVIFITEGTALLCAGTDRFTLSSGQGFFINAGILHAIRDAGAGSCRLRSLVFHPRLAGGSPDSVFWQNYIRPLIQNEALEYVLLDGSLSWHQEALQNIRTAWEACSSELPGYEFLVRSSLSWLLFLLFSHRPADAASPSEKVLRDTERAKQMLQYIQEHFSEELTTAGIASSAGVSESEALRCFRSTIGIPPVRYLRQYRIQQAASLLVSDSRRISEIGTLCGFEDASYFTKIFREQKGCTPSEYRRKNREILPLSSLTVSSSE